MSTYLIGILQGSILVLEVALGSLLVSVLLGLVYRNLVKRLDA